MISKSVVLLILTLWLSALECVFEVQPAPLRMTGDYFSLSLGNAQHDYLWTGEVLFLLLFLKRRQMSNNIVREKLREKKMKRCQWSYRLDLKSVFGIVKFSIRSHGEPAGALKRLEQKHCLKKIKLKESRCDITLFKKNRDGRRENAVRVQVAEVQHSDWSRRSCRGCRGHQSQCTITHGTSWEWHSAYQK